MAQRCRDAAGLFGKQGARAEAFAASVGCSDHDLIDDAARSRRHDRDASRQINAFEDGMRNKDDRGSQLALQCEQIIVQSKTGDFIQGRKGLVEEKQRWIRDKRPGERCTHAHTAGKFAWVGLFETAKPHAPEHVGDARRGRSPRLPGKAQGKINVREYACPRHQRRILKHETDLRTHAARPDDLATRRLGKTGDQTQDGRLAAA